MSRKWAVPSPQSNIYTIGLSKKIFLYFRQPKDMLAQTRDLLESEILKCRMRHGMKDLIMHSDVGDVDPVGV